jgi:signal recognition particle subunit SRP54
MQALRKMASLSKIFGMLPGMGDFKDQIDSIDERDVDRIAAIIQSMTPGERDNPKVIDGSRRSRIARGSGVAVSEVNNLVDRFFEARKMMTSMAKGMPGMPGMPGAPGVGRRAKAKQAAKKGRAKRGSGNPAKRAQQEAAAAQRAKGEQQSGEAFGFGGDEQVDQDFELPGDLRDLLGKGK